MPFQIFHLPIHFISAFPSILIECYRLTATGCAVGLVCNHIDISQCVLKCICVSVCVCKCNNFRNQNKTVTHDCRFVANKLNFPISIFLHALLCSYVLCVSYGCVLGSLSSFDHSAPLFWPFCGVPFMLSILAIRSTHSHDIQHSHSVDSSVNCWQFASKLFLYLIRPRHSQPFRDPCSLEIFKPLVSYSVTLLHILWTHTHTLKDSSIFRL